MRKIQVLKHKLFRSPREIYFAMNVFNADRHYSVLETRSRICAYMIVDAELVKMKATVSVEKTNKPRYDSKDYFLEKSFIKKSIFILLECCKIS